MQRTLAFILAGGAGSRLGALALHRAKPAVPFGGNYRLIDYTIGNAARSGVSHMGVLVQYQPDSIIEYLGNGERWGLTGDGHSLQILAPRANDTGAEYFRGTADAIRKNLNFLEKHADCDCVLILSGDHVYRMDYTAMVDFHRQSKAEVTVGMTRVPLAEAHRFGIAEIDNAKKIVGWQEKPANPHSNLASMGIYVFSREFLFDALWDNRGDDFGHDIIPHAIENAKAYAYEYNGYWRDVGTLQAYWKANLDLVNAMQKNGYGSTNGSHQSVQKISHHALIAAGAKIENSIISPGCIIEGMVTNSVLSPGVWVKKNAVIRDSIVMHDCEIGEYAIIKKAILDEQVMVGNHAIVGLELGGAGARNSGMSKCVQDGLVVVACGVKIPRRQLVPCNVEIYSENTFKVLSAEKPKIDHEIIPKTHSVGFSHALVPALA